MKRRYVCALWLPVLAAGFVLACGAGRAGATDQQEKLATGHKQGKAEKKRKVIKIKAGAGDDTDLVWYGKKKRGFLGVHLLKLNQELRTHFGSDKDAGVLIAKVEPDTPARKAGLQVGDVLAEIDGEKVTGIHQVIRLIGKKKDGEKARLKIVRRGQPRTLTATIQERERAQVEVSRFIHKFPKAGEELEVEVDAERLDQAMERAHQYLEKFHDGEERVFKFRHRVESDMEKRLKEMEEKIEELEKKLQGRLGQPAGRRTT